MTELQEIDVNSYSMQYAVGLLLLSVVHKFRGCLCGHKYL